MRDLQNRITKQAVLPYIQRVNSLLQQAVSTCEAAQMTKPPESMEVKESVASGKKSEHQWRFKPTCKAPGRKKSGLVLRYELISFAHTVLPQNW